MRDLITFDIVFDGPGVVNASVDKLLPWQEKAVMDALNGQAAIHARVVIKEDGSITVTPSVWRI